MSREPQRIWLYAFRLLPLIIDICGTRIKLCEILFA